jgi:hypothetical protein
MRIKVKIKAKQMDTDRAYEALTEEEVSLI